MKNSTEENDIKMKQIDFHPESWGSVRIAQTDADFQFLQVGTLVTGFLSQTELGAQSVLLRYAMFSTGFVFALAAAPITLMGRAAGALDTLPPLNSSASGSRFSSSAAVSGPGGGVDTDIDTEPLLGASLNRSTPSGGAPAGAALGQSASGASGASAAGQTTVSFLQYLRATVQLYIAVAAVMALVIAALRSQLASASTSVPEVVTLVTEITPYMAIFVALLTLAQGSCCVAFARGTTVLYSNTVQYI